ncbi:hypothetical protein HZB88_02405 [archaeon]|nr:hypothetical protein [archaeon]
MEAVQMIFGFLKGVKDFVSAFKRAFSRFLETKASRKFVSFIFAVLAIAGLMLNIWHADEMQGALRFFFSETAFIVYLIFYALALLKFSMSWHVEDEAKRGFRVIGLVLLIVGLLPVLINTGILGFIPVVLDLSLSMFNAVSFSLLLFASAVFGWMG